MITNQSIHLKDVQAVYSGPEGELWELLMGEQIHIGGLVSSQELAEKAMIPEGSRGIDLCSALGAGMRFLLRFRHVARMTGVDGTPHMIQEARARAEKEGLLDRMDFVQADVTTTGLPIGSFDFVWGEDAWCYVEDKPRLIAEAVRLIKPAGTIAFTDWMLGGTPMGDQEAQRLLQFMKFPSMASLPDYRGLLEGTGCRVLVAGNTGRFPSHVALYLDMIEKQLTYDALRIINFDASLAQALIGEMRFMQSLATEDKLIQGLIVAAKG
jgi:SAM-dependent methyltransferase